MKAVLSMQSAYETTAYVTDEGYLVLVQKDATRTDTIMLAPAETERLQVKLRVLMDEQTKRLAETKKKRG